MKPLELVQTFACGEDWDAMPGDKKQRHCAACDRHLLDLSQFTEREAHRLAKRGLDKGEFCAVFTAVDGRLVFQPETPNRSIFGAAAAVAILGLPMGCDSQPPAPTAQAATVEGATQEAAPEQATPEALANPVDAKSPEPTNGAAAIPVVSSDAELPEACAELTPEEERHVLELEARNDRSELAKSTLFKVLSGPKPANPLKEDMGGSFSLKDIEQMNEKRKRRHRTVGKLAFNPDDLPF